MMWYKIRVQYILTLVYFSKNSLVGLVTVTSCDFWEADPFLIHTEQKKLRKAGQLKWCPEYVQIRLWFWLLQTCGHLHPSIERVGGFQLDFQKHNVIFTNVTFFSIVFSGEEHELKVWMSIYIENNAHLAVSRLLWDFWKHVI